MSKSSANLKIAVHFQIYTRRINRRGQKRKMNLPFVPKLLVAGFNATLRECAQGIRLDSERKIETCSWGL